MYECCQAQKIQNKNFSTIWLFILAIVKNDELKRRLFAHKLLNLFKFIHITSLFALRVHEWVKKVEEPCLLHSSLIIQQQYTKLNTMGVGKCWFHIPDVSSTIITKCMRFALVFDASSVKWKVINFMIDFNWRVCYIKLNMLVIAMTISRPYVDDVNQLCCRIDI